MSAANKCSAAVHLLTLTISTLRTRDIALKPVLRCMSMVCVIISVNKPVLPSLDNLSYPFAEPCSVSMRIKIKGKYFY